MGSAFPELLPVTGFRQRSNLQHIQRRYRPGFAPGYLVQQKAVHRHLCHGMGYQIVMGILTRKSRCVNAVNDRLAQQLDGCNQLLLITVIAKPVRRLVVAIRILRCRASRGSVSRRGNGFPRQCAHWLGMTWITVPAPINDHLSAVEEYPCGFGHRLEKNHPGRGGICR